MPVTQEQIHSALREVLDPNTGKDFFADLVAWKSLPVFGSRTSLRAL